MTDIVDVDDRHIVNDDSPPPPAYIDINEHIRMAASTEIRGRPRMNSGIIASEASDATDATEHITISERLRETTPMARHYSASRFRGLSLADVHSYSSYLNRLLGIIYSCRGIVYGGAVRDLLRGIVPSDIDIHIRPGNLMRLFRSLRESFVYSISRRKPSDAYIGERYTVIVEPSHIYTDAAMFVLDITAGIGDLYDLPVDYNVNMLYINTIDGDYAIDVCTAVDSTIKTAWCTVKTRGGCSLLGILDSLHNMTAYIDHECCVPDINKRHIYCTIFNRVRREKSLQDCGFADVTKYICTNIACRLASVSRVIDHALQSAKYGCETNTELYVQAMGNDTHLRKAIGAQIRSIVEKINEPSDRTMRERVLAVADFSQTVDRLMPKTPDVVHIRAATISDCVDLRRAIDDGAIDDYRVIVTATRGYIAMVKRIISESLDANAT